MAAEEQSRLRSSIKKHFKRELEGILNKKSGNKEYNGVMDAAISICETYALSAEDLYFKWEAFSMDTGDLPLGVDGLETLAQSIRKTKERELANTFATPRAHAPGVLKNGLSTAKKPKSSLRSLLGGASAATNPVTPSRPHGPPQRTYGSSGARQKEAANENNFKTPAPPPRGARPSVTTPVVKPEPITPAPTKSAIGGGEEEWWDDIFQADSNDNKQGGREGDAMMDVDTNAGAGRALQDMDVDVTTAATTTSTTADATSANANGRELKPAPKIRKQPIQRIPLTAKEREEIKVEADISLSHEPFQPVHTLNEHLSTDVDPSVKKGKVSFGMSIDPQEWDYRYMFEQKRAYTAALDERIDKMAELIEDYYELEPGSFGDPSVASQADIYVVGRICPGLPHAEDAQEASKTAKWSSSGVPKLSDTGIVLETSKKMGDGDRIPIIFESDCKVRIAPPAPGSKPGDENDGTMRTDHFGIFPGMLVGLLGRNGTGDAFAVQELLLPPRLPEGTEEMKRLERFQYSSKSMNGQPMRIMVAAGPFTSDTDLAFGPLEALIERVIADPPDVLILLGPFLSRTHPILLSGQIDEFPDTIFRKRVGERLGFLLNETKESGLRIAMVPSTKDVITAHAAFPQPMFEKDTKDAQLGFFDKRNGIPDDKRLFRLPNPCAVWINECFIGLSTADVLRDIRSEEMVIKVDVDKPDGEGYFAPDPILRACGHIICQRCFYPLYPSSPASNPPLPLDVSHAHLGDFVTVTPDILILPSVLTATTKLLDPTICVNPGALGGKKGDRGGSLAMLTIHPQKELPDLIQSARDEGQSDRERIEYNLASRTRVDVLKL